MIVGLAAEVARRLWTSLRPRIREIWSSRKSLQRAHSAVATSSRGLWLAPSIPVEMPTRYKAATGTSIPIIVLANLKGGVGKTTIAANLVAHYAIKKNERVLAIDLDFQGSLTACSLSDANRDALLSAQAEGGLSKAAHLINDRDAFWLQQSADPIENVPTAKIIPAYYSLAAMENRVMVEWLTGKRPHDVRYHLARILHDDLVQQSFDRIIIDAPPRLTTGCVQALSAATHVLIPTVLDTLSTDAVGAFADQLRLHQEIWPHLRIVGVVGTMTSKTPVADGALRGNPLTDVEIDAHAAGRFALEAALERASPPLKPATFMPIECFVPDKTELGRGAGHRIVYATPSDTAALRSVREIFDRLGDEIDRRIADKTKV